LQSSSAPQSGGSLTGQVANYWDGGNYKIDLDSCHWKVYFDDFPYDPTPEDRTLFHGHFDDDGNPIKTKDATSITQQLPFQVLEDMGPADFVQGLGDDVDICAQCRSSYPAQFTGAETWNESEEACKISKEGVEALKAKLDAELKAAEAAAATDKLQAIKDKLDTYVTDLTKIL
jgi:hypothetical protein